MQKYLFNYTGDGSKATSELVVIVDNSDIPSSFVTGSTFTITGATNNIGISPLFIITNCGTATDGQYRALKSERSNHSSKIMLQKTRRAISFSSESECVAACPKDTTFTLTIPPTRIIGFEFYPISNPAYGSSTIATITITNDAGNITLATFTYTMNSPGVVKMTEDCNYYVDAFNGDKLKLTFTSNYSNPETTIVFKGSLYAIY
jgi:hypothetical protein